MEPPPIATTSTNLNWVEEASVISSDEDYLDDDDYDIPSNSTQSNSSESVAGPSNIIIAPSFPDDPVAQNKADLEVLITHLESGVKFFVCHYCFRHGHACGVCSDKAIKKHQLKDPIWKQGLRERRATYSRFVPFLRLRKARNRLNTKRNKRLRQSEMRAQNNPLLKNRRVEGMVGGDQEEVGTNMVETKTEMGEEQALDRDGDQEQVKVNSEAGQDKEAIMERMAILSKAVKEPVNNARKEMIRQRKLEMACELLDMVQELLNDTDDDDEEN